MKQWKCYVLFLLLLIGVQAVYAENNHQSQTLSEHRHSKLINISPEGQQAAGIKVEVLRVQSIPIYLSLPGEAIPNKDLSAIVTPRIKAQVVKRLVKTGDHVEQGQPLVQLSSVEMAKAQAELLSAYKEWVRAKQIKQGAIAAKYYHTADVDYQQKYSKLLSYGMNKLQINAFLKSNDPGKADGAFTLLASRKGTIFSADFTEGEMIEPGRVLYKIVDESSLWVDAKLSNNGRSGEIRKGAKAIIQTAHFKLTAQVLQAHHRLEKSTRTRIVRLNVPNPNDQLHPGEFVTCLIQMGKTAPVLAVEKTALVRNSDGNMAVYVEVKPNHFEAKEVQVIKEIGRWSIIKGIKSGVRIVTEGAFFVHSESLKGGFDTHNH